MENALSAWAFGVMDKYISDLVKNGKYDVRALDHVDFTKSHDLLKKLSFSSNERAVLEAAFLACPLNDAVYESAAERGLCDAGTLKLQ